MSMTEKRLAYLKRKRRVRKKIRGNTERPRLNVFKSNRHMYAQIIDDVKGRTIVASSTLNKDFDKGDMKGKTEVAKQVGELLARKAKSKGIKNVVFDRNGFLFHGRVKALAEGAREGGLDF